MEKVFQFLRERGQSIYTNQGIAVVSVADEKDGVVLVLSLLEYIVDRRTVLYLSGGRTPKTLYAEIAREEKLRPSAFAMVDERYGPPATHALALRAGEPMQDNSNEKILRDTGLLRYTQMRNIPFYSILNPVISRSEATRNPITDEISHPDMSGIRNDKKREQVAEAYDDTVRSLLAQYQKHIAILGVGLDGHTAGIPATASLGLQGVALREWLDHLDERNRNRMVIDYDDKEGFYKERITMTFLGLSMMDILIVLVFGEDKKKALELMFSDGSEEEVPSRFLKRPEIAKKMIFLTDRPI